MPTNSRSWIAYPATYRAAELRILADWIAAGESGSVVGLAGCGRSNLLGFLCRRADVLKRLLPEQADEVVLIPVEIYNLPANDLSNLYRTILHAAYWIRERFEPTLAQAITDLYLENRAIQDAFLSQKALYTLFLLFQRQQLQVVLVLNRFDRFCEVATPQMISTLRGLRDDFKGTLSYLVGMLQEAIYLPDPTALGGMYELLDSHVCWVGALAEADARHMLNHIVRTAAVPPSAAEVTAMLRLSGRFPSLLQAVGHWWRLASTRPTNLNQWCEAMLEENSILHRLERIWNGLTQEEKLALSELQKSQAWEEETSMTDSTNSAPSVRSPLKPAGRVAQQQQRLLVRLAAKGLCEWSNGQWRLNSTLVATYVASIEGRVRGKIWLDEEARTVYQGEQLLEGLTNLQYEIVRFLLLYPRIRHTRDDIIDNAWPEEEQREGITPNALQVHIASIRKKIEPNPAQPRYLLTWHGRPGGYQFFPEGKPE